MGWGPLPGLRGRVPQASEPRLAPSRRRGLLRGPGPPPDPGRGACPVPPPGRRAGFGGAAAPGLARRLGPMRPGLAGRRQRAVPDPDATPALRGPIPRRAHSLPVRQPHRIPGSWSALRRLLFPRCVGSQVPGRASLVVTSRRVRPWWLCPRARTSVKATLPRSLLSGGGGPGAGEVHGKTASR